MSKQALTGLRQLLESLPSGPVPEDRVPEIGGALIACWDTLDGSTEGGMRRTKLVGRMERMTWSPPQLSFTIERHGAVVLGSVYAELQCWRVNPAAGTAAYVSRRRLIGGRDTPLKVEPQVDEIATAIKAGKEDPRLVWMSPTRVRIKTALVIEATNKQTTSGRRRRFVNKLEEALAPGWRRCQAGSHTIFETRPPSGAP